MALERCPSRILVYGVCGSGKTIFASRLSEKLGIPWHSVDDLTWEPGWVEVPQDVQVARIASICAEPCWILDTAYARWLEVPLADVELVVGLDYPRWLSLGRLMKRTVRRIADGRPICNGNRETLRELFSRSSIIIWHFKSFSRKRARMRHWQETAGFETILFKRPRDAAAWLETLSRTSL